MVFNTINATFTETYDMSTTVGSMTILGFHTPTAMSLKRMFKGYFEQYKKIKIHSMDLVGVCASGQSLTPEEVGLEAGKTDPRDVLNPILFKACTGENLNLLLDEVYGSTGSDNGSMHRIDKTGSADLDSYYTMLADDSFRKFHPQGGVAVTSLKPFVHKVATTQPFKWNVCSPSTNGIDAVPEVGSATQSNNTADATSQIRGMGSSNGTAGGAPSVFVSNGLEPMPWLETTYEGTMIRNTDEQSFPATVLASNIPKCYCGVLVLPPANLVPLYFRFQVRWHLSFKDFRPAYEIGFLGQGNVDEMNYGMSSQGLYYNLYNSSKLLEKEYGSFDVAGADSVNLVNEKVH